MMKKNQEQIGLVSELLRLDISQANIDSVPSTKFKV